MKLSRETWHAITILSQLARLPAGTVLDSWTLSESLSIPHPFVSKILQKLKAASILRAHRGASRGYSLARRANDIALREIVESIEGPELFKRCIFSSEHCSNAKPCALHEEWALVRPRLQEELDALSLAEVAKRKSRGSKR